MLNMSKLPKGNYRAKEIYYYCSECNKTFVSKQFFEQHLKQTTKTKLSVKPTDIKIGKDIKLNEKTIGYVSENAEPQIKNMRFYSKTKILEIHLKEFGFIHIYFDWVVIMQSNIKHLTISVFIWIFGISLYIYGAIHHQNWNLLSYNEQRIIISLGYLLVSSGVIFEYIFNVKIKW